MASPPRLVEVRQHALQRNDLVARELRARFERAGVFVVSLVASPGAGKTTLLERLLTTLVRECRAAALVGDLATENDARRLARSGAAVRQITTGVTCHLEAQMVADALTDWNLAALDFLFIENVGNLVCPASYDLGEQVRLVLFAVTEGEDKPRKYPTIFNTSDCVVISKLDLADAVGFERAAALASVQAVRPGMPVIEVSARTGAGLDALLALLHQQRAARAPAAAS
jgi:hydrogenase nickel incorporation protein HypB